MWSTVAFCHQKVPHSDINQPAVQAGYTISFDYLQKVPSNSFPAGLTIRHARLRALLRVSAHGGPHKVCELAVRIPSTLALYAAAGSRCSTHMAPSEVCIAAAQDHLLNVCTDVKALDLEAT